jgi:hypothetical protein
MTTETHFAMRLRERAGINDAAAVYQDLRIALANPEQYPDYLDFVMKAPDGKDIWRVKLETGRFYIIAAGTFPVTVYTQHHMRRAKENRRRKKGR